LKAAEATPSDPRAITLFVAIGTSRAPGDTRPGPGKPAELPAPARAVVENGLARLAKLAESEDDAVAARALEGIGAIGFLRADDPAKVESTLRRAIAKDPSLRQAWTILVGIRLRAQRWDDLVGLLGEWLKTGETAEKRMFLAKAEERRGDGAAAEKQWRLALALDPKGYEPNLGLAAAILRNSKAGDDLEPVDDLFGAAGDTYRPESPEAARRWVELGLTKSVALGLAGDLDGAADAARRVLEFDPPNTAAKEVLAAIGR
jgi:tetratricopeptide (TPR) repeat protein